MHGLLDGIDLLMCSRALILQYTPTQNFNFFDPSKFNVCYRQFAFLLHPWVLLTPTVSQHCSFSFILARGLNLQYTSAWSLVLKKRRPWLHRIL